MSAQASLVQEARAAGSDRIKLAEISELALSNSVDPSELVMIGILTRDVDLNNESIAIFDKVIKLYPTNVSARYEKAILYMHQGNHLESICILREILSDFPNQDQTNLLASRVLHSMGAHHEASDCLNRIDLIDRPNRQDWIRQIRIVHEFGAFVRCFPKNRALALVSEVERASTHLRPEVVADRIAAALRDRVPFSLIRVGDGEGAFVRLDNVDEARFANLYARNREDRAGVWFAGSVDPNADSFLDEASQIGQAMENADITGMPYTGWIEHEFRILSVTGISSLVNLLRVKRSKNSMTCSQLIHVDLHRTKLLYEILKTQHRIGLISCHRELPEMLKQAFSFSEINHYHVPGEKGHSHLLSKTAVEGTHWPDRYREIMRDLSTPLNGTLFIVAAGILGKFYCDQIKKFGGVAVDIGSIADGWVGSKTRPGLDKIEIG